MMSFTSADVLYVVLIGVPLLIAVVLARRQGPYRVEVPANRFVRWCIVYVAPVGPAFLPLLVLVWLWRLLSIDVPDPITARIIVISIFVPMYLWGVLSCRKLIREQDSRQRIDGPSGAP